MKDKFIEFLVKRELLEKFIKNTGMNDKAFNKYLKETSISDYVINAYVISAFTWKYSPEGTLFWDEIDEKWRKEIKDEDKTIEELLK